MHTHSLCSIETYKKNHSYILGSSWDLNTRPSEYNYTSEMLDFAPLMISLLN